MQTQMNNLPKDPALLMQQLKGLGNYKGNSQNRRYKLDIQRATLESRLMEAEDYTHTEEGARRMRRYQEEVEMDEEAVLSMAINIAYREATKAVFRDNLREEAEKRLALEAAAKEKKRQEALARRQAIIDQMRREKEEEERRVLEQLEREQREKDEAMAAEQREAARLKYLEQLAAQNFAQNRRQMEFEDELSRMFEAEWQEAEAARIKREAEEAEQRAFAEEQRRRNEADELNRKQRMMELQLKKQRLQEMRKSQQKSKAETDAALAAARAEADAQAKRQRIQNKAMYVSKRLKATEGSAAGAGAGEEGAHGPSAGGEQLMDSILEDSGGGPSKEQVVNKKQSMAAFASPPMSPPPAHSGQKALKEALAAYRAHLLTVTSVEDLRRTAKELMAEKRQMRLQQRNSGGGDEAEVKETKRRLVEVASKEELVEQRIDELSKKKEPPKKKEKPVAAATPTLAGPTARAAVAATEGESAGVTAPPTAATKGIATAWLANSLLQKGDAQKEDPTLMTVPFAKPTSAPPGAKAPPPAAPVKVELTPLELLLQQCENLLRDILSATQVLGPLVERGITDEEFVKKAVVDARQRGSSIELEMVSLGRKYKSLVESPSQDPLEYMEQIRAKWPALRKLMFKMGNYQVEHTAALVIAAEAEKKLAVEVERVAAEERVRKEAEMTARRAAEAEARQAAADQARAYAEAQAEAQRLNSSSSGVSLPLQASAVQGKALLSSSSVPALPAMGAGGAVAYAATLAGVAPAGAAESNSIASAPTTAAPMGTSFAPIIVAGAAPTAVVFATAGGAPGAPTTAASNASSLVSGFAYTSGGVSAATTIGGGDPTATKFVTGFGYTSGGVSAAVSSSTKSTVAASNPMTGFGYTAGGVAAAVSASMKGANPGTGFGYIAGGVAPAAIGTGESTTPVAPAVPSWQKWYNASAIAHAATPFAAPGGGSMYFIEGGFSMGGIEFCLGDFMDKHEDEHEAALTKPPTGFGYTAGAVSHAGSQAAKVPIGPGQVPVQFAVGQVPIAPGEVAVQFAPGQVPVGLGQVAVALGADQVAVGPGQVAVQLSEGQVPIAPGRAAPKRMPAGKVAVQFAPGQVPVAPGKVAVHLSAGQVAIAPGKSAVQLAPGQVPIAPGLQAIQLSAGQVAVAPGQEVEAVEDNEEPDGQGEYMDEEDGEDGEQFDPETLPGWQDCLHTTMATAAHHAAFYGFAEVLEFLSNCFDCYVLDEKKRTPLFYACLRGHMDCVSILIGIDANWVDTGDHKGDTPIHAAAISNSTAVLKFLLQCCEVSPDTTNNEGMTPSHIARSKSVLEVLYYANAQQYCVDNCNRNPLYMACSDGRVDCVDFLCRVTPAEYLLWPVVDTAPHDSNTALHIAAANGHHKCVDILCQWLQTDSLYVTNKKGHTPAHVAKNALVLQKLYEHGMDLWVADAKYRYPLFIAAFYGRFDAVSFLLEVGTNKLDCINAKDVNGDTALHAAALNGSTQCIVLLLYYVRAGANKQGLTPKMISEKRIIAPPPVVSPVQQSDEDGTWSAEEVINTIGNARTSPRGPSKTRNTILIDTIESQFRAAYTNKETNAAAKRPDSIAISIYGCSFGQLVYLLQTYGSRWCKCYDASSDSYYFYDRLSTLNANVTSSCWDRPPTFDELEASEDKYESACEILKAFYTKYNPDKISSVNDILNLYRNRYGELFLQLAERYSVTDLRMFGGIDLSND